MWIFLNTAMLSIIDPRAKYAGGAGPQSPKLLVRARIAGDIEAVFPAAKVQRTEGRDYLFRSLIAREDVSAALVKAVENLDYQNFKGSVPEKARHDAYMGVWGIMNREQERRDRPRREWSPQTDMDFGGHHGRGFLDEDDYSFQGGRYNRHGR